MGLLFAQGGGKMHRNGVLLVNTPGYMGTLRCMPMESRAFWSFEGEGALDQEDLESVASEDNEIERAPEEEVFPAPPQLQDNEATHSTLVVQGF